MILSPSERFVIADEKYCSKIRYKLTLIQCFSKATQDPDDGDSHHT
jgi:hypothetical protein